jgi:hypothetical protein
MDSSITLRENFLSDIPDSIYSYDYELSFISFATNRLMAMLFFIGVHNKFLFYLYKIPSGTTTSFFLFYIYLMLTNHMFRMNDNFFDFFFSFQIISIIS